MRFKIGKKAGFELTANSIIRLLMLLFVIFIIIMSFRYSRGGFDAAIERITNIF